MRFERNGLWIRTEEAEGNQGCNFGSERRWWCSPTAAAPTELQRVYEEERGCLLGFPDFRTILCRIYINWGPLDLKVWTVMIHWHQNDVVLGVSGPDQGLGWGLVWAKGLGVYLGSELLQCNSPISFSLLFNFFCFPSLIYLCILLVISFYFIFLILLCKIKMTQIKSKMILIN